MLVYDDYVRKKLSNKECLIFIKVGNFYHTFDDDAVIINYLFDYAIKVNRVGFPILALNKVINKLDKLNVNYCVDDIVKGFDLNNYNNIFVKANDVLELNNDIEDIYNYLISNVERKYIRRIIDKIKVVIDDG